MTIDNPYIFGNPEIDRQRLVTQALLFKPFLLSHVAPLVGGNVRRILDVGCGDGVLAQVLLEIYPQAQLVGIDRNPQAIERARATAEEIGLRGAEYVVGDVEEGLPPGPFDLVYISFVLLHTRRPDKIVQAVYDILRPGGFIWVKDLDPGWATALQSPSYRKLVNMIVGAMTTMGAHPNITLELPALLGQTGFVNFQQLDESYVLGGMTTEGRTMLAVILGVFYNARAMLSKMHNISEAELERLHLDLCNAALRSNKELGREEIANIVAMRPLA